METVYDRALLEVGLDGKFQTEFNIIYIVIISSLWTITNYNIILALTIIPYTCKTPLRPANISEYEWKVKYIPMIADENDKGQAKFSTCSIYIDPDKSNATRECTEYDFDGTWFGSTIPSAKNWACGEEIKVANVYAFSQIGEAFGSMVFGWIGDVYGRRIAYMMSLAMIFIGRSVSLLSDGSYLLFAFGCFIACFPSATAPQTAVIVAAEISSNKRRGYLTTLRFVFFSVALVIMPFIYWWLRDWKLFIIVTTVTMIPFILFSWRILESPRWLWTQGKPERCIKQLKKIAKTNGRNLTPNTEQEIMMMASSSTAEKTKSYGFLMLFSNWTLGFHTALQCIYCMCIQVMYIVLVLSGGQKRDGNPFVEFALQAAAETPGNILGAYLSDRLGRRYTGVVSLGLSTVLWVLIVFREQGSIMWLQPSAIGTLLYMTNRLMVTVGYYVIYVFNMELYPTCLRQSGMALGNFVFASSGAFAPFVLLLGRQVDVRLPGIILAFMSMLGGLCSFLLPETLNARLPETLEDAQMFGHDRKYFSLPQRSKFEKDEFSENVANKKLSVTKL